MSPVKAFVCGCQGFELDDDELKFFEETRPWGLILFRRNVDSPEQLDRLTRRFRNCVGRDNAPVLVDQEGGRVQRLTPPQWHSYPAAASFAERFGPGPEAERVARLGGRLLGSDLRKNGFTIDCAPVLDTPVPGAHQVIGSRAFASDPDVVARLGRAFAEGLLAGGVLPVIKHMPGHGRAGADTHLELAVVSEPLSVLETTDFVPFRRLADLPIAMTAHVVFSAIDPHQPATTSKIVIERVMRGHIGFDGLLCTDDLSMEALKGSLGERASAAAAAGCEMLLHCNGKLDEARAVAAAAPLLLGRAAERAENALSLVAAHVSPPSEDDWREFEGLFASA